MANAACSTPRPTVLEIRRIYCGDTYTWLRRQGDVWVCAHCNRIVATLE